MRQEYEAFWGAVEGRFLALDNTRGAGLGTIRMVQPEEPIDPQQIAHGYAFMRTIRWTANDYPKYVLNILPGRGRGAPTNFTGLQENPTKVTKQDGTVDYIITGNGIKKNPKEYNIDSIKCICTTPQAVNTVRALGDTIRAEHSQFWLDTKERFKQLDPQHQPDEQNAPRV